MMIVKWGEIGGCTEEGVDEARKKGNKITIGHKPKVTGGIGRDQM